MAISFSIENTMYGTLGSDRTAWNEEINEAMGETIRKGEYDYISSF